MPMFKESPEDKKERMDTERAVAENSKVTGKARTMDLIEQRKAMAKKKMKTTRVLVDAEYASIIGKLK